LISDGLKFGNDLNESVTKTKVAFQYASRRSPQESRNVYQKECTIYGKLSVCYVKLDMAYSEVVLTVWLLWRCSV